jgi:hypothetical protein
MKTKLHLIMHGALTLSCLFSVKTQAQTWTWLKGPNTGNQIGTYGTIGTAAPANSPGGRTPATSWTDSNNDLWMFGGFGYGSTGIGCLNDLWKYNSITNQWAWIKGNSTTNSNGVYSGFIPANNCPGARSGSVGWVDNNGDFWMFGGEGYAATGGQGMLNDLWKYTVATNQWSCQKGSNTINQGATYGTPGVSAIANTPGARAGSVSWTDSNGNLWLFGGSGYITASTWGNLNDLWMYNISTSEWVWVSGDNIAGQAGIYGTLGTPAIANKPSARSGAVSFNDGINLWLFGGLTTNSGYLNDLWKYNIATNQWTWMNGASTANLYGTFGTQGVFSAGNTPGGKWKASGLVSNNQFLLFGGEETIGANGGYYNTLWKYDIILNQWAWVKGANISSQSGVYGTQGVAAMTNVTGSRIEMVLWKDPSNNLCLFGGYGFDLGSSAVCLNDVWKFTPCIAPSSPSNTTPSANLTICSNNTTSLSATGTGTVSWYNAPTGGSVIFTGTNFTTPVLYAPLSPMTFAFYAEDLTCAPSITRTAVSVTVNPLNAINATSSASLLCSGQSATLTANGASSYSWNTGGNTSAIIINPTVNTTYTVIGANSYNCSSQAVFTQSVSPCAGIENQAGSTSVIKVFPNPFSDKLSITGIEGHPTLQVFNFLGELILTQKIENDKTGIDLSSQPDGVYFIKVVTFKATEIRKVTKQ